MNTVGAYQATPNQTTAVYPQLASTRTWILPNLTEYVPQQFGNLSHAEVCTLRSGSRSDPLKALVEPYIALAGASVIIAASLSGKCHA